MISEQQAYATNGYLTGRKEFSGLLRFAVGDLHQNAARRHGITVQAQRCELMQDDRMKIGSLEARANELRVAWIESCIHGNHGVRLRLGYWAR